jgi:hypothetical protein
MTMYFPYLSIGEYFKSLEQFLNLLVISIGDVTANNVEPSPMVFI